MEKVLRAWDQAVVAEYSYDAWGNPIDWSGPMAEINLIRYRGYYYDTETGFYYLQSRYYDPQTGRFINADGLITTGQGLMSYNMFAYCLDNPVNKYDYNGLTTYSIGIGADGAIGIKVGVSFQVVFDDKGNVGIAFSISIGGGTPSAAVSFIGNRKNADTIYDLRGLGFSTGGSNNIGGLEVGFGTAQDGSNVTSLQGSISLLGLPVPVEFHGEAVYTYVIAYDDLPENYRDIIDRIFNEHNQLITVFLFSD